MIDARAIRAYTAGVLRARDEYRQHPFTDTQHGPLCAVQGCPLGLRRVAYIRNYRARKRAEGRTP